MYYIDDRNHVQQLIRYSLVKLKREERYISYFHKPIVPGWTTPSSSWRRWRCRWRRRRPLRLRSAGVFPSNLQPPGLCFFFLSYGGSLLEERRGALYIGDFRSRGPKQVGPRGQVQASRGAPTFGPPDSVCLLPSLRGLPPSKK